MTLYLKESWYMGDSWYEDWEEVNENEHNTQKDIEDWDFGVDPERLDWIAPEKIENNCTIWEF